jgi:hypothetical protein
MAESTLPTKPSAKDSAGAARAGDIDWVKKRLALRERLVEIAKTLRKFPWIVEVIKQRAYTTPTQ